MPGHTRLVRRCQALPLFDAVEAGRRNKADQSSLRDDRWVVAGSRATAATLVMGRPATGVTVVAASRDPFEPNIVHVICSYSRNRLPERAWSGVITHLK